MYVTVEEIYGIQAFPWTDFIGRVCFNKPRSDLKNAKEKFCIKHPKTDCAHAKGDSSEPVKGWHTFFSTNYF